VRARQRRRLEDSRSQLNGETCYEGRTAHHEEQSEVLELEEVQHDFRAGHPTVRQPESVQESTGDDDGRE